MKCAGTDWGTARSRRHQNAHAEFSQGGVRSSREDCYIWPHQRRRPDGASLPFGEACGYLAAGPHFTVRAFVPAGGRSERRRCVTSRE